MRKPVHSVAQEVSVRRLAAADLPRVARIHCAAFPNSVLSALRFRAVERYYHWQLLGPHDVTALGAEWNHTLIGFCFAGVFRGALSGFLRANRGFLALQVLLHPWLLGAPVFWTRLANNLTALRRAGRPRGSEPPAGPAARSFGVLAIAVDPAHQGRGAGKSLMQSCEEIARKKGFMQMHLTVEPQNEPAINFYERSGWMKSLRNGAWSGSMRKILTA